MDAAIAAYTGDFLEGAVLDEPAFDAWAEQERNGLRTRFRTVLGDAIRRSESDGRWSEAIAYSRRLAELLPLDEDAARMAATTLLSAGRRTEARDVLLQFGARLHAELGLALPSELHSLLSRLEKADAVAPPAPIAAQPTAALRFSGREAELSQLLALWRVTGDDAGTIALIEGAAGIGKTRLVQELLTHARSLRRATALTGRERSGAVGVPFALLVETLRPLVRAPGIVGASRHLLAEASRLLPELRDSLDLPALEHIEDEAARVRFFEGVAALVDAAAYEHPLLLALEDLEHVPPSSLDLLSYLTARLGGAAVMFVLTVDPDRAPAGTLARLRALVSQRQSDSTQGARSVVIELPPLTRSAALAALEPAVLATTISSTVAERIVDRAAGVPGRIGAFLQRVLAGDEVSQLPLPARDLALERVHRLSSSQRRAFLVLSLLGRPCTVELLGACSHLPREAAAETAAGLVAVGLAMDMGDGIEAQPLAAEAALEEAGQGSRAFLAGWIADALVTNPQSHPAELARFFAIAGRAQDAFSASRQAAFAAMHSGAWPEAVQHLKIARSFATMPAHVADVEGLLSALGAGNLRVASGHPAQPAVSIGGVAGISATSAPETTIWKRWFPNWRVLFGAAVATLLITTFVLSTAPGRSVAAARVGDTLVVLEGEPVRAIRFATGDLRAGFELSSAASPPVPVPSWIDSLSRPWTAPLPGPNRQWIAVTRIGTAGNDLYLISGNRRDTVQLTHGERDARALGWSPDERWVLVATAGRPDAGVATRLHAVRWDGSTRIPLDTAGQRSVVEAAWSPDGSRIAWVARVGETRQQEVYAGFADGTAIENLTRHPADDYHIAWSGDGEVLGFTSVRDGNAELYAVTMRERRLWRLTRDPAQDDRARFSSDGRVVVFESTRGGRAGVYVMPALGGATQPIGQGLLLSVEGWRRGAPRYLDHIRVESAAPAEVGDTAELRVVAVDQLGDPIPAAVMRLVVLDTSLATVARREDSGGWRWLIRPKREGMARIVADVGGWRRDTALVRIGLREIVLADGPPSAPGWRLLGEPRPVVSGDGTRLNGDAEWESGILSRLLVPLVPGLSTSVEFTGDDSEAGTSLSVALVVPEETVALDTVAPQFLRLASFSWDSDARRSIFAAGREIASQLAADPPAERGTTVELRVEMDSTVSVLIDGTPRWRSTLKISASPVPRAQLWIGSRATAGGIVVRRVRVALGAVSSR